MIVDDLASHNTSPCPNGKVRDVNVVRGTPDPDR